MAEKHIHKLARHKYKSGNIIYFCTLPDCNYKVSPALALGKRSLCNRCGEPFILSSYSIRLSKPHCDNCHKPKENISKEEGLAIAQGIKEMKAGLITPLSEIDKPTVFSLSERLKQVVNSHKQDFDEDEI